jgi:hypothetical protein
MEMRIAMYDDRMVKEVLIKFKDIEGVPTALEGGEKPEEIIEQWIPMMGTYQHDEDSTAYFARVRLENGDIIEFPVVNDENTGWAQVDDKAYLDRTQITEEKGEGQNER